MTTIESFVPTRSGPRQLGLRIEVVEIGRDEDPSTRVPVRQPVSAAVSGLIAISSARSGAAGRPERHPDGCDGAPDLVVVGDEAERRSGVQPLIDASIRQTAEHVGATEPAVGDDEWRSPDFGEHPETLGPELVGLLLIGAGDVRR